VLGCADGSRAESGCGAAKRSPPRRIAAGDSPITDHRTIVSGRTPRDLQVSFGWSDQHLYSFQIRGWQFGDPARAIELALAGGGVDIPLAAFGLDIGEPFLYQYNLLVPREFECRIEPRGLIRDTQPVTCRAARGNHRMRTLRVRPLIRSGEWTAIQPGFCSRSRSYSTRTSTTRVSELKRVRFSPRLAANNLLDA
jgi:hypothetical protein